MWLFGSSSCLAFADASVKRIRIFLEKLNSLLSLCLSLNKQIKVFAKISFSKDILIFLELNEGYLFHKCFELPII